MQPYTHKNDAGRQGCSLFVNNRIPVQGESMSTEPHHPAHYAAIGIYAYIADCHSQALISKSGSIDWCCMPRVDSASCFGRLPGWHTGGHCQIAPATSFTASRQYLKNTLVLETLFEMPSGTVRLLDSFSMRKGGQHSLRIIESVQGSGRGAWQALISYLVCAARTYQHKDNDR